MSDEKKPYNLNTIALCKEPELLPFNEIRVGVPRQYILHCYRKEDYLTAKEADKMREKLKQVNQAISRLRHTQSLAELVLLKSSSISPGP